MNKCTSDEYYYYNCSEIIFNGYDNKSTVKFKFVIIFFSIEL